MDLKARLVSSNDEKYNGRICSRTFLLLICTTVLLPSSSSQTYP